MVQSMTICYISHSKPKSLTPEAHYLAWSVETEVRKRKYGSEKKNRLSVFSALLTHKCVYWGQKVTPSLRC